jgi:hypothetical protein
MLGKKVEKKIENKMVERSKSRKIRGRKTKSRKIKSSKNNKSKEQIMIDGIDIISKIKINKKQSFKFVIIVCHFAQQYYISFTIVTVIY